MRLVGNWTTVEYYSLGNGYKKPADDLDKIKHKVHT